MTNLEWIRSLPVDRLAEFLESSGAEAPDYCDAYCQKETPCEVPCGGSCKYASEKEIWVQWLKCEKRKGAGSNGTGRNIEGHMKDRRCMFNDCGGEKELSPCCLDCPETNCPERCDCSSDVFCIWVVKDGKTNKGITIDG